MYWRWKNMLIGVRIVSEVCVYLLEELLGSDLIWFDRTYCIKMTLGSCPSLGSNSLGSSLRQSSRRLCSSLSFFSSTALPLDRPLWLGWLLFLWWSVFF